MGRVTSDVITGMSVREVKESEGKGRDIVFGKLGWYSALWSCNVSCYAGKSVTHFNKLGRCATIFGRVTNPYNIYNLK